MQYNNYKVYQKALERLVECVHLTHRERRDDASLLYELVNKEKPAKLLKVDEDCNVCPICNGYVEECYIYCPNCGRKIDWGRMKMSHRERGGEVSEEIVRYDVYNKKVIEDEE